MLVRGEKVRIFGVAGERCQDSRAGYKSINVEDVHARGLIWSLGKGHCCGFLVMVGKYHSDSLLYL
jgi:hypothetical protein